MHSSNARQYIVRADVLPEVFLAVSRARELLETGQASTVAEAAARVGISRSAYYKYKNAVTPFRDIRRGQVLTLSVIMHDKPGTLSAVLAIFADIRANILTINQSIPTNGAAIVTLSIVPEEMEVTVDELRGRIEALPAVIRVEMLAG